MTVINPNSIAGIASVSSQGSTLAIYANNVQFSGSIGVAGTVTYDDVTNVDSIGVITARTGINLTGAGSSLGIRTDSPKVCLDASQATDAFALPKGTTVQRPASPDSGYMRWNDTSGSLEVYNGSNWIEIVSEYFPEGSGIFG